jgi:hypothetical protein
MDGSKDVTPWDFAKLVKDLSDHEAELKMKLAKAGVAESDRRAREPQTSSTNRP